jgi:hypothetical protein
MRSPQEEARQHARAMLEARLKAIRILKKLFQESPESMWDLLHELGEAHGREGDNVHELLNVLKRQGVL